MDDLLLKEIHDRLTDMPTEQTDRQNIINDISARLDKVQDSYDAFENPTAAQTARIDALNSKFAELQEATDDDTLGNAIVPEDAPLPPQAFVDAALVALAEADVVDNAFVLPSAGNATVPVDAPIQPPQAFVDVTSYLCSVNWLNPTSFDFHNMNLTEFSTGLFDLVMSYHAGFGARPYDFSGNHLSALTVNAILHELAETGPTFGGLQASTIDLSGGTNAAPTGQGLTDKATLISNGWTVTTN